MRDSIIKILRESDEWGWADEVPGLPNGMTMGEPIPTDHLKNKFKITTDFDSGRHYDTRTHDWSLLPYQNIDRLTWIVKALIRLEDGDNPYNMSESYVNGELDWFVPNHLRSNIQSELDGYDEDDTEQKTDIVNEWMRDEMMSYGLIQYDDYNEDDSGLYGWGVTYFDSYGIEHSIIIDRNI